MRHTRLTSKIIKSYETQLRQEEKSPNTIKKYMRDIMHFYDYLPANKIITRKLVIDFKQNISDTYTPSSVNTMLVSVNLFLDYLGLPSYRVKLLKIQRTVFYEEDKGLNKEEYLELLGAAKEIQNERLYMLVQTICATGIRVSELPFITVEALKIGKAVIRNKGKLRVIYISKELSEILLQYCCSNHIQGGSIFVTKSGRPIDRSNIWRDMQRLCEAAKVAAEKGHPHNLRHLFALTHYNMQKDIVRLASLLGHTSIETTRIYTMTTGGECMESLSQLDLTSGYSLME